LRNAEWTACRLPGVAETFAAPRACAKTQPRPDLDAPESPVRRQRTDDDGAAPCPLPPHSAIRNPQSAILKMLTQILFYFFAGIAVLSAAMTVSRKNPVSSALWLIGTFFALAAIYTLLGAFFIGIIQILVYAGAIMVLFLFVIMLLNLGNDYVPDIRSTTWKVVAAGTSLVLLALLVRLFSGDLAPGGPGPEAMIAHKAQYGPVGSIGVIMFSTYAVHLQVAGLLLLIAVVGAVALAKREF
jgi:NADH-quinone oxidoreductase subunit J